MSAVPARDLYSEAEERLGRSLLDGERVIDLAGNDNILESAKLKLAALIEKEKRRAIHDYLRTSRRPRMRITQEMAAVLVGLRNSGQRAAQQEVKALTGATVTVPERMFFYNVRDASGRFSKSAGTKAATDPPLLKGPTGQLGSAGPTGQLIDPSVPKFASAEEAAAWMLANYGIVADLSAFTTPAQLAALRGVLSGLKDSISMYPSTAHISITSVKGNGDFCAQTTGAPGGKATIRFDVNGIMALMTGQIKTGGKNFRAYTWQDPRGMVAHEMGHVYSFQMSDGGKAATRAVAASIAKRAKAVPTTSLKVFPSVYSRVSDNEAFAEVFATTVNKKAKAYYTAKPAASTQLKGVVSDYNAAGFPPLR